MPNTDKIVAAQQRVETLADELSRISASADLFDRAEEKQQAVIRAAEAIIENAGAFADEGTEIIQRLQRMDLERHLGEVKRELTEIGTLLDRRLEHLGEFLSGLREKNKDLIEASGKISERIREENATTQEKLADLKSQNLEPLQKAIEQQQKYLAQQNDKAARQQEQLKRQHKELEAIALQSKIGLGGLGLLFVVMILLHFL